MHARMQESAVSNLKSLDELLRWATKHSGARGVAGQVAFCPPTAHASSVNVCVSTCISSRLDCDHCATNAAKPGL